MCRRAYNTSKKENHEKQVLIFTKVLPNLSINQNNFITMLHLGREAVNEVQMDWMLVKWDNNGWRECNDGV